jgi:very-short-patch-repair endonuclease
MYSEEGLTTTAIARQLGCGSTTVSTWLKQEGIPLRPKGRRSANPGADALRALYWDEGRSSTEIAEQLGVTVSAVCGWLREANVPLRSASERGEHWLAQRTPEERASFIEAAHAAVRGTTKTHADLCRRATEKQRTMKPSALEAELLEALQGLGHDPILNFAVDKYNVDLAFPDLKLAVEVDGGNWHNSAKKRRADEPKQTFLEAEGWKVLRFSDRMPSNRPIKDWSAKAADAVSREVSLLQNP